MGEVTARRERARPMSPEERRAAIVEATVPLVIEHGGAVTTRLIAEAAGVAEGTIFRAFADKRALFHAVAEHVMNPLGGREELAAALAGRTALREKVVTVVERMHVRSYRVMAVMMALRSVWMADAPDRPEHHREHHHEHNHEHGRPGRPTPEAAGPPALVVEAQRQLLDNLTELLFEPHADELRVDPRQAALALRSVMLGSRHPGLHGAEEQLTAEQVADVVLRGVATPDSGPGTAPGEARR